MSWQLEFPYIASEPPAVAVSATVLQIRNPSQVIALGVSLLAANLTRQAQAQVQARALMEADKGAPEPGSPPALLPKDTGIGNGGVATSVSNGTSACQSRASSRPPAAGAAAASAGAATAGLLSGSEQTGHRAAADVAAGGRPAAASGTGGLHGQLQLAAGSSEGEDERSGLLQSITHACERLMLLSATSLDLERVRSGRMRLDFTTGGLAPALEAARRSVTADAHGKGVVLTVSPQAAANVAVRQAEPAAEPLLLADWACLGDVLRALVAHAVQHTDRHGHVRIRAHQMPCDDCAAAAHSGCKRSACGRLYHRTDGIPGSCRIHAALTRVVRVDDLHTRQHWQHKQSLSLPPSMRAAQISPTTTAPPSPFALAHTGIDSDASAEFALGVSHAAAVSPSRPNTAGSFTATSVTLKLPAKAHSPSPGKRDGDGAASLSVTVPMPSSQDQGSFYRSRNYGAGASGIHLDNDRDTPASTGGSALGSFIFGSSARVLPELPTAAPSPPRIATGAAGAGHASFTRLNSSGSVAGLEAAHQLPLSALLGGVVGTSSTPVPVIVSVSVCLRNPGGGGGFNDGSPQAVSASASACHAPSKPSGSASWSLNQRKGVARSSNPPPNVENDAETESEAFFEPFGHTSPTAGAGQTRLSLALGRELARLHGGDITITQEAYTQLAHGQAHAAAGSAHDAGAHDGEPDAHVGGTSTVFTLRFAAWAVPQPPQQVADAGTAIGFHPAGTHLHAEAGVACSSWAWRWS